MKTVLAYACLYTIGLGVAWIVSTFLIPSINLWQAYGLLIIMDLVSTASVPSYRGKTSN